MKTFKEVQLKGIRNYLIILLTVFGVCDIYGQNERSFHSQYGKAIVPRCTTYDGGLLLTENFSYYDSTKKYCSIIKYSLEGLESWRVQLNNMWVYNVIETADSGFALCGRVNIFPGVSQSPDPMLDTIEHVCLLRFDKCARVQWAKYVKSRNYNLPYGLREDKSSHLFLCAWGVNGIGKDGKELSVLKFSKTGELKHYKSFEGIEGTLPKNEADEYIYLMQYVYLPLPGYPDMRFLFTGLKKLDKNLNIIEHAYLGYTKQLINDAGNFLFGEENIIAIGRARSLNGQSMRRLLFANLDKNFKFNQDFTFSSDSVYELCPISACKIGDTLAVLCQASDPQTSGFYSSLRLFDKKFNFLKEVKMNLAWTAEPITLLPINGGEKLLVGVVHSNWSNGSLSYMYFFDRHLNPVSFPKNPPAQPYDWGCTSQIPKTQQIEANKVVTPVYLELDNTKPDWDWLLSIHEPDPQNIGRISNGWFVWPQPAAAGQGLHLKVNSGAGPQAFSVLQAKFYNMQGRQVATVSAMPEGEEQWGISSLELPGAGLYLVDLVDTKTGVSVGRVRVMVE